jgi:hypothetical protein
MILSGVDPRREFLEEKSNGKPSLGDGNDALHKWWRAM